MGITIVVDVQVETENPIVEIACILAQEYESNSGFWTDPQRDGWKDMFSNLTTVVEIVLHIASRVWNGMITEGDGLDELAQEQFFIGMMVSEPTIQKLIDLGVSRLRGGTISE